MGMREVIGSSDAPCPQAESALLAELQAGSMLLEKHGNFMKSKTVGIEAQKTQLTVGMAALNRRRSEFLSRCR